MKTAHDLIEAPKKEIQEVVSKLPIERTCGCSTALASSIITNPEVIPEETKLQLEPIVGKYLK